MEVCSPLQWRNRPRFSRGSLHLAVTFGRVLHPTLSKSCVGLKSFCHESQELFSNANPTSSARAVTPHQKKNPTENTGGMADQRSVSIGTEIDVMPINARCRVNPKLTVERLTSIGKTGIPNPPPSNELATPRKWKHSTASTAMQ